MVNQAATRRVIRQAVGRNLKQGGTGGVELIDAAADGTTTTFLSDLLAEGSANEHRGKRWLGTDAPNDEVYARVTDSSISSNRTTLTLFPAVSSTKSADTAELWTNYDPKDIEDYINQAIREITGLAYDPEESLALHADGRQTRFDIETKFAELHRIDFRSSVEAVQIDDATDVWDELGAVSNVTNLKDTKDYKRGPASFRMVVTAGAAAGLILATKKIDSKNIAGMDFQEFWIKCSVATSANDLQLLLDDTAQCTSPLETLNVPALTADTWTYVRVALANPELDTAIISVGLKYTVDIGACTIWLNHVKTVLDSTATWPTLRKDLWGVDKQTRDLVLKPAGRNAVGYSLLKLVGGDKPALLNADATVCEVNDWYVICRATALALMSASGGSGTDPDALRAAARYWELLAQQAKNGQHLPQNIRVIS